MPDFYRIHEISAFQVSVFRFHPSLVMAPLFPTVIIENLSPQIEGGRYPIKRIPGEEVTVTADIFKEGHDVVLAMLKWRSVGEKKWKESSKLKQPIQQQPAGSFGTLFLCSIGTGG